MSQPNFLTVGGCKRQTTSGCWLSLHSNKNTPKRVNPITYPSESNEEKGHQLARGDGNSVRKVQKIHQTHTHFLWHLNLVYTYTCKPPLKKGLVQHTTVDGEFLQKSLTTPETQNCLLKLPSGKTYLTSSNEDRVHQH